MPLENEAPLEKAGVWEGFARMLRYNPRPKNKARSLRTGLTDAEKRLWGRLRRKQILGVQFYRQKAIGNYIVDFYAPGARLVMEVDGSQHVDVEQATHDRRRSDYLELQRLRVLRFDEEAGIARAGLCNRGDISGRGE